MSGRSLLTTVTSLCSSPCSPVEALPYSTHLCLHPEKASQHLRCTAARLAKPQLCLRLQAVLEGSAAGHSLSLGCWSLCRSWLDDCSTRRSRHGCREWPHTKRPVAVCG